jgi:CheY-like chemotaxis protein
LARKILLADDSVTAQNMGRKILADAGYDVVTVNNGSAALKRITEIKPDLIVLDVYMPGYSGLEVCQRLKDTAETAHIPVLLTVGKLEPFKPEEARRVRADGHIVKPFEASELLTAITRLEDRMVPQSEARFSTSVSGLERFGGEERGRKAESGGETDTGWKSRLRFPSKKKKEEPEPEPEEMADAATFRDFRKKKGKPGNGPSFTVKEPAPPGQEPGLVPDIPRDITPDELDALSAVAAKLDGLVPEAEDIAPLAAKTGPTAAAEVAAAQTAAAKMEAAKAQAVEPETAKPETTKPELELPPPAEVVAAAAGVDFPAPAVEGNSVESQTIESKNEVEIPVEQLEPASDAAPVVAGSTPEKHKVETDRPSNSEIQPPDLEASSVTFAVNPASLAQGAAPVEQDAVPEKTDQRIEVKPPETVAKAVSSEVSTPAETAVAQDQESKVEESAKVPESKTQELAAEALEAEELKTAEPKAKELETAKIALPAPNAANAPKPAEAEEPVPSDEELAEALRLLTPATVHTDIATLPSHGTLVAAGQLLAEEVARNAATGPRWVAELVALSPEEAAISLEAEMFRTFATTFTATSTATPAPMAARGSTRITGVSAITAAVENRLAEAGMVANARAVAEQQAECDLDSTLTGTSAVAAPGETTKTASSAVSPVVEAIVSEISARATIPPDESVTEKPEVVQKGSSAKVAEEAPPEEVATATFADAVGRGNENEDAPTAQPSAELVSAVTAMAAATETAEENPVEEQKIDSSSDSGSEESMGKDGKSGTWHQIRTAPAGAAANTNLVEAAKQAEASAEQSPKAMAAAAAEGSVSTSTTDASTIASIVDSVMADLRPKIVEEIAKKLSGK